MTDLPTSDNLTRRTLAALTWTYGSTLAGIVPQVVYTTIMARLLSPADFGLVALAQVFLRFGTYFANLGIGQALVQKPELNEREIRAAFTATAALGALFAAAAALAAPLASDMFDTPEVVDIIRVLSISFFLDGAGKTATNLLRRDLRFSTLAKIEFPTYLVAFLGVGLGSAAMGAGVWSLVAATLAQSLLATSLVYAVNRHPARPLFVFTEVRHLYGFGGRISVIGFLEFLGGNLDVFFIGRYLDQARLGQYNRAYYLGYVPFTQLSNGLSRVMFPAFSRVSHNVTRLRGAYLSAVGISSAILLPVAAGMGAAAPELTRVVLGPGWSQASAVLPVLAMAQAIGLVTTYSGVACEARAMLNPKLVVQALVVVVGASVFAGVAAAGGGLVAFATTTAVLAVARHGAYLFLMRAVLDLDLRQIVPVYLRAATAAAVVGASVAGVSVLLRAADLAALATLAVQMLVGGLALAGCAVRGPLVTVAVDVRHRLENAGALGGNSIVARGVRRVLREA